MTKVFLSKPTKWTGLLLSPQSGRIHYEVHKMGMFVIKSIKWTTL